MHRNEMLIPSRIEIEMFRLGEIDTKLFFCRTFSVTRSQYDLLNA